MRRLDEVAAAYADALGRVDEAVENAPDSMTGPIAPPVTWFGGKAKLAPRIIGYFPAHQTYVEPFGGSAAVLLAKPPSPVEVYNDVDGDLVNLFRVLRDPESFEKLRQGVDLTLYAREEFELALQPASDPIEAARRFLVRQRQSHGGHGRRWSYSIEDARGGMASSVRRWIAGVERLPDIHKRLRTVQIERDDWRVLMRRFDSAETLFYFDPPYQPDTRVDGEYAHELSAADHESMVKTLLQTPAMVVLSGYAHPAYMPLEQAGWQRIDMDVPAYSSSERSRRIESLWLSPNVLARGAQRPQGANATGDLFAGLVGDINSASFSVGSERGARSNDATFLQRRKAEIEIQIRDTVMKLRLEQRPVTVESVAEAANLNPSRIRRHYRALLSEFDWLAGAS